MKEEENNEKIEDLITTEAQDVLIKDSDLKQSSELKESDSLELTSSPKKNHAFSQQHIQFFLSLNC